MKFYSPILVCEKELVQKITNNPSTEDLKRCFVDAILGELSDLLTKDLRIHQLTNHIVRYKIQVHAQQENDDETV